MPDITPHPLPDLTAFTDREQTVPRNRYDLSMPWVQSGWRCACDHKRLALHKTALADTEPTEGCRHLSVDKYAAAVEMAVSQLSFTEMPSSYPDCPECGQTGGAIRRIRDCTECGGLGSTTCEACNHEEDCNACDGNGWKEVRGVAEKEDRIVISTCTDYRHCPVSIGGRWFGRLYIREMFRHLVPPLTYHFSKIGDDENLLVRDSRDVFVFLMPVTKDEA